MKQQQTIKTVAITWNLMGNLPPITEAKKLLAFQLFQDQPDFILIATQECQRSLIMSFFCESKDAWESILCQVFDNYRLFASHTLQGMHSAVMVLKQHSHLIVLGKMSQMKAGFCNMIGNKGAISIQFSFNSQNFQMINCHLSSDHEKVDERNQQLMNVCLKLLHKDPSYESFLMGDFNYRVQFTNHGYQQFLASGLNCGEDQYKQLIQFDQLNLQRCLRPVFFQNFKEGQLLFPPTYKMDLNRNIYEKSRKPGWTDRIFHRRCRATLKKYICGREIFGSDHRPVLASFTVPMDCSPSVEPIGYVDIQPSSKCALI